MIFVIDFDGTIVHRDPPLRLIPGVRAALLALKRAGHTLVLFSARSNRAHRFNLDLDPLVAAGIRPAPKTDADRQRSQRFNNALHWQMVAFVNRELPGVFDAIDEGAGGKPIADFYIDDKAINPAHVRSVLGSGWQYVAMTYGEQ